jgi:hypothetical protein
LNSKFFRLDLLFCSKKRPTSAARSSAADTQFISKIRPFLRHKSVDFKQVKKLWVRAIFQKSWTGKQRLVKYFYICGGIFFTQAWVWKPGTPLGLSPGISQILATPLSVNKIVTLNL